MCPSDSGICPNAPHPTEDTQDENATDRCGSCCSGDDRDPRVGADGQVGKPVKSDALTEEQQKILEQRGYLKPEEIHKLATKTKKAVAKNGDSESPGKASCHSDYVDDDEAKRIQQLVQVDVRPAMGIAKDDRLV